MRPARSTALLGGLVAVSAVLRSWASWNVTTPWIVPDEPVYALLGRSLYAHGRLRILQGPTGFLSAVAPALFGLPLSLGNLELGYDLAKVVNAFVMSLAAVPAYLWARSLVPRGWALAAAVLTLALPGLAYSGLMMSEVVFYPVLVLAAWALAAVLERPSPRRQLLFLVAVAVAVLTRLQAIVLVVAFIGAVAVEWRLARRVRVRAYWPTAAGLVLFALVWVGVKLATGGPILGGYEGARRHYPLGRSLEFVLFHAGDLVLLTGFVPVCAVAVLVVTALRRGEPDARARAYLATASALAVTFVVEVGLFASQNVGHLAERDLIALAPVCFVGFALWLARLGPGGMPARAAVALVAAALVIAIPADKLATPVTLVDAFSAIPLYHLRGLTSTETMRTVLALGIAAAAVLFALLPRRLLPVLPVLVAAALAAGSVSASRQVVSESDAQRAQLVGPVRRWIDDAADGPTYYLYTQQTPANAPWQALFWNRRIQRVYDLPLAYISGPMPQGVVRILPDGTVTTFDGSTLSPAYAVVSQAYALVGRPVAYSPSNADRSGFALWAIRGPLRVSSVVSGVAANGDLGPGQTAEVNAYDCTGGRFRLTLLVKEPETVRIALDGGGVRTRTFAGTATWNVTIPVHGTGLTCRLTIAGTGLTGTTRLAFEH